MKLTTTQQNLLNEFNERINYCKSCSTYEEYIMNNKNSNDRQKAAWLKDRNFETNYTNGKNNTIKTFANSNTLRALAKKGYIKLVVDGLDNIDTIVVL